MKKIFIARVLMDIKQWRAGTLVMSTASNMEAIARFKAEEKFKNPEHYEIVMFEEKAVVVVSSKMGPHSVPR